MVFSEASEATKQRSTKATKQRSTEAISNNTIANGLENKIFRS